MDDLLVTVLEYAVPVLLTAIAWVVAKLGKWLKIKAGNEATGNVLFRVTTEINTLVSEAGQTLVKKIKEARSIHSPGGKKLTPEEAQMIKKAVLDKFKNLWGLKGLAKIGKILGFGENALTSFLEAKIEEAVKASKNP